MSDRKWKGVVVHHMGGWHKIPEDRLWYDSVVNYHTKHLGWKAIGYHFFIEFDGLTIKTKRWANQWSGAHTKQHKTRDGKIDLGCSANECMLGVCLAGNFDVQRPTKDQLFALKALLEWLKAEVITEPDMIFKHSDFADKTCPALTDEEWNYVTGKASTTT